jgi:hypothetical protein
MKRIALATTMLAATMSLAMAGDLFMVCDNGLRCVRPPCPSRDVVLLPSGKRFAKSTPDTSMLTERDQNHLRKSDGLYYGPNILEGIICDGRITAR